MSTNLHVRNAGLMAKLITILCG